MAGQENQKSKSSIRSNKTDFVEQNNDSIHVTKDKDNVVFFDTYIRLNDIDLYYNNDDKLAYMEILPTILAALQDLDCSKLLKSIPIQIHPTNVSEEDLCPIQQERHTCDVQEAYYANIFIDNQDPGNYIYRLFQKLKIYYDLYPS
ncbi:hypothetical protein RCL_jg14528.t1 [Rhizophagus clarus]|uniref:Uncharacterized protein n=1 Tax=Rhizophagus clarus TaxID=94130 RepID=A0A8H3QXZ0_9GLOM|nr:hypothetical protein RCL_jg14528.t1 [Rhizophagus clarus]